MSGLDGSLIILPRAEEIRLFAHSVYLVDDTFRGELLSVFCYVVVVRLDIVESGGLRW